MHRQDVLQYGIYYMAAWVQINNMNKCGIKKQGKANNRVWVRPNRSRDSTKHNKKQQDSSTSQDWIYAGNLMQHKQQQIQDTSMQASCGSNNNLDQEYHINIYSRENGQKRMKLHSDGRQQTGISRALFSQNKIYQPQCVDMQMPPLLDLSVQRYIHKSPQYAQIGREKHQQTTNYYLVNKSARDTNFAQSIYIQDEQSGNDKDKRITGKAYNRNNISNLQTTIHEENSRFYSSEAKSNPRQSKVYAYNMDESDRQKQDPKLNEINKLTIQTYASIMNINIENSQIKNPLVSRFNQVSKNNEAYIQKHYNYGDRSNQEILVHIFSNFDGLDLYLAYLIQQSIIARNKFNSNFGHKLTSKQQQDGDVATTPWELIPSNAKLTKSNSKLISGHKKNMQVTKLLACLLIKIKQASIRCGRQLPSITISNNGQHIIDFGPNRPKTQNRQSTVILKNNEPIINGYSNFQGSKFETNINQPIDVNKRRLSCSENKLIQNQQKLGGYKQNKQNIKKLEKKLLQQDSIIQKIKYQYDQVINNYAKTVQNLLYQKIKRHSNLEGSIDSKRLNSFASHRARYSGQNGVDEQNQQDMDRQVHIDPNFSLQQILSRTKIDSSSKLHKLARDSKNKQNNRLKQVLSFNRLNQEQLRSS